MNTSPFFHRIAVSNIATPCFCAGIRGPFVLAIQNDSARKAGRTEYGAIGGGALMTAEGCAALCALAPTTFELHDDNVQMDARLTFSTETESNLASLRVAFLRSILGWARSGASGLIELEITREFIEELVEDAPGILTMAQLTSIHTRLVGWKVGSVRQSNRGATELRTTPFYFCHEVVFEDPSVLATLLADNYGRVKIVSPEELATTNGGRNEGRTRDGHALFTNVFDPRLIRQL